MVTLITILRKGGAPREYYIRPTIPSDDRFYAVAPDDSYARIAEKFQDRASALEAAKADME